MIKRIINNNFIIFCMFVALIIGYLIGYDIKSDFLMLYISKISHFPIRYSIIVVTFFLSYCSFSKINNTDIIFRYKSVFHFLVNSTLCEVLIVIMFFIFLHIPVFIINYNDFANNICIIFKIMLNCVIVTVLLTSIIKLIDIKINNRTLSSCILLGVFAIMEFVVEHYNIYYIDKILFDFSYLYILPYCYNYYIFIAVVMILLIVLLTSVSANLISKKDYLLYDKRSN